jgi:hypothetical protein
VNRDDYIELVNWYGGFYELAIEYVPKGDDERLLKAIAAIWGSPLLTGPWQDRNQFGEASFLPDSLEFDSDNHLYGVLELPNRQSLGCLTVLVRESDDSDSTDRVDFCIPTGMLDLVFPVSYPLARSDNPWMKLIDPILLSLAERVYQASPFDMASIGEEVSGNPRRSTLSESTLVHGGIVLPSAFAKTFAASNAAIALPSGLHWFPPSD